MKLINKLVLTTFFLFSSSLFACDLFVKFESFGCSADANIVLLRDGLIIVQPTFIDDVSYFANHSIKLKEGSLVVDQAKVLFKMDRLVNERIVTEFVPIGSVKEVSRNATSALPPVCVKFKDDTLFAEFTSAGPLCPQVTENSQPPPHAYYFMNCSEERFAYLEIILGEYWAFSGPNQLHPEKRENDNNDAAVNKKKNTSTESRWKNPRKEIN